MKKFVCLLLAAAMLLMSVSALADYTTFSFTTDDYVNTLTNVTTSRNLPLTWVGVSEQYGYPMTVAQADGYNIYVSVHDSNGVVGIEVDGSFADAQDTDGFTTFGTYMNAAYLAAYVLTDAAPTDEGYLANVVELVTLLTQVDDDNLTASKVIGATLVVVKANEEDGQYTMMMIIAPADSTLGLE